MILIISVNTNRSGPVIAAADNTCHFGTVARGFELGVNGIATRAAPDVVPLKLNVLVSLDFEDPDSLVVVGEQPVTALRSRQPCKDRSEDDDQRDDNKNFHQSKPTQTLFHDEKNVAQRDLVDYWKTWTWRVNSAFFTQALGRLRWTTF